MTRLTLLIDITEEELAYVVECGHADCGAVGPKSDAEHTADAQSSLAKTREFFSELPESTKLHGLYKAGTDIVMAHTGNSPKAGIRAAILIGLWNKLVIESKNNTAKVGPAPFTDDAKKAARGANPRP